MSPNYFINQFLHSEHVTLLSVLLLFLLRMVPILAQAVFFGASVLPTLARILFALTLFMLMLPKIWVGSKLPMFYEPELIPYLVKEVLIGFILGFFTTVPFQIASGAGMIIDFQRGSSSLAAQDPTMRNQSSPLGLLYNQLFLVIFFYNNGPQHFFEALITSYEIIPIDKFPLAEVFQSSDSLFWKEVFSLIGLIFKNLLQLAAPALITILMTDTFLGIANRLAPQVQITFLGMPLKSLLGLGVLALSWRLIFDQTIVMSTSWFTTIRKIIQSFYTLA